MTKPVAPASKMVDSINEKAAAAMRKLPARTAWMHARCVYIHELFAGGDSLHEIARLLTGGDVGQVHLLLQTNPDDIVAPFLKRPE